MTYGISIWLYVWHDFVGKRTYSVMGLMMCTCACRDDENDVGYVGRHSGWFCLMAIPLISTISVSLLTVPSRFNTGIPNSMPMYMTR